jgi:excinuclease ABC subunit B
VIVVASVSCIYGLGSPEEYRDRSSSCAVARSTTSADLFVARRDALRAQRQNLVRGKFRVRGDTIEVHPAYEETRFGSSCSATRSSGSCASTR